MKKRFQYFFLFIFCVLGILLCAVEEYPPGYTYSDDPYVLVLGIGQDGGVPQAGTDHPGWENPKRAEKVVSLGVVDPKTNERWMIEATPDFRRQLHMLNEEVEEKSAVPDGIFLTHAHIGHYTGLMFLGHESMGADKARVYAMPKMAEFLSQNGPWNQLVKYENIALTKLATDSTIVLNERISITPFLVPHRQEYSEVVGYRIEGPDKSILFIPDIDSWEEWDEWGVSIEEQIKNVDIALLDATFFANGEIPGRDMSNFPHPFISHSMDRFSGLSAVHKAKVHFIHFNHTNPALVPGSEAQKEIVERGYQLAKEGQRIPL
ncbi:MAG: MBL fold metallo-hydrolase [Balneolaceae bacterium]|nr:MBL fold metallo-hydrolase [Balneolaceae bacterium]